MARLKRRTAELVATSMLLSGCDGKSRAKMPSGSGQEPVAADVHLVASEEHASFVVSEVCAECHSNVDTADAMRDGQDRPVGFFDLWQSSMMANASRDPLWRAVVSAEVSQWPQLSEEIEGTCMRCHAPMAAAEAGFAHPVSVLDQTGKAAELAQDGVSCTVCHQITPDGLGTEESFSGGFQLNAEQIIYGPHSEPFERPMVNRTGYLPQQSDHINDSALCATCHTLRTKPLDEEGMFLEASLPEQMPYLEWLNSKYSKKGGEGKSCQVCHMPRTDEDGEPVVTALARNPFGMDFPPVGPREPYARHVFVGGNTLVPALLRDHREQLGVTASVAAFNATIRLAEQQLQENTARLSLRTTRPEAGSLQVTVTIDNLAGHKFPTGHPARRAWLRLLVQDLDGQTLFASGRFDSRGVLVDGGGRPLPSELKSGPTLPHYNVIDSEQEVYVLESVMGDPKGQPTFSLLRGASYLKDNRLLPAGFAPEAAVASSMAPVGTESDSTFAPGTDSVTYSLSFPGHAGTITASLYYQPLSVRYARELFEHDTPEVAAFKSMYESADLTPIRVAEAQVAFEEL
jgi:hypothetical protein